MLYPEDTTKVAIEVKDRLSVKYNLNNFGLAHQFLGIKIHCEETVPVSVLARRPSSPHFSDDSTCKMLSIYQLQ
jgi:hypothetical protein